MVTFKTNKKSYVITSVAIAAVICSILCACSNGALLGLGISDPTSQLDTLVPDETEISSVSYQSKWMDDGGAFHVVSKELNNVSDYSNGNTKGKRGSVTVVLENNAVRITNSYTLTLIQDGSNWIAGERTNSTRQVEPLVGVSSQRVEEQITTILDAVKDERSSSAGTKILLSGLYKENLSCSVTSNSTTSAGGDVVIEISASKGFAHYKGQITASFEWKESDFSIIKCTATPESYQADYSSLLGSWVGTFHEPTGFVTRRLDCYGGQQSPLKITVKSVDSDSMMAKMDFEVLVHRHDYYDNPVESDGGDAVVQVADVLVPLESDTSNKQFRAYTSEEWSSPVKNYFWIDLEYVEGKSIEAEVVSGWAPPGMSSAKRLDAYTLTKV